MTALCPESGRKVCMTDKTEKKYSDAEFKCYIRKARLCRLPVARKTNPDGSPAMANGCEFVFSRDDGNGVPEEREHAVSAFPPSDADVKAGKRIAFPEYLKRLGWDGMAPKADGYLTSLAGKPCMVKCSPNGNYLNPKFLNPMPLPAKTQGQSLDVSDMLSLLSPKSVNVDAEPSDNDGIPF